ncbi:MAG: 3-hydroxyacyl-CoA dehydrogenase NAD-binding domain-containing protein [Flammeovirgaceae bacterium]
MTKEIRSVAVLGGGTMGAGIAGLCAERDIKVLILEINQDAVDAAKDRLLNGIPAPIDNPEKMANIETGTFDKDLEKLKNYDWICEAIIENAEAAIVAASRATQATVSNFTAAPVYLATGKKGTHEWVIEFDQEPSSLNQFTSVLDDTLRSVNSDYDAKRQKDIALIKPIVHHAAKGTFYNWMKKRGKLGGQNKVPRLSNNREYLDDILELMKMSAV